MIIMMMIKKMNCSNNDINIIKYYQVIIERGLTHYIKGQTFVIWVSCKDQAKIKVFESDNKGKNM